MYRDSGQFGSFEGLDNRKAVMELFVRMGDGVPEEVAREKRKCFLQRLLVDSENGFASRSMSVTPCSAVEAYHLFVAITGCLGVPIEKAARKLEAAIR
jgi:hypothetical protein